MNPNNYLQGCMLNRIGEQDIYPAVFRASLTYEVCTIVRTRPLSLLMVMQLVETRTNIE